jgi:hypothetical protein
MSTHSWIVLQQTPPPTTEWAWTNDRVGKSSHISHHFTHITAHARTHSHTYALGQTQPNWNHLGGDGKSTHGLSNGDESYFGQSEQVESVQVESRRWARIPGPIVDESDV